MVPVRLALLAIQSPQIGPIAHVMFMPCSCHDHVVCMRSLHADDGIPGSTISSCVLHLNKQIQIYIDLVHDHHLNLQSYIIGNTNVGVCTGPRVQMIVRSTALWNNGTCHSFVASYASRTSTIASYLAAFWHGAFHKPPKSDARYAQLGKLCQSVKA